MLDWVCWLYINVYVLLYHELWQENDITCTLMADFEYTVYLQPLHKELSFLSEKRVIDEVTT